MSGLQLCVKKEYRELVPRPDAAQYEALKKSIKANGLQIPLTVNQDGVVLDGHTRLDVCNELGIAPTYEVKKFDDPYEERRYVIIVNLARRQLTLFQKAETIYAWWQQERELGRKIAAQHRLANRLP